MWMSPIGRFIDLRRVKQSESTKIQKRFLGQICSVREIKFKFVESSWILGQYGNERMGWALTRKKIASLGPHYKLELKFKVQPLDVDFFIAFTTYFYFCFVTAFDRKL